MATKKIVTTNILGQHRGQGRIDDAKKKIITLIIPRSLGNQYDVVKFTDRAMTENKFNHETPKITKITTEKEKLKRIQFCKDLTIRNRQKLNYILFR